MCDGIFLLQALVKENIDLYASRSEHFLKYLVKNLIWQSKAELKSWVKNNRFCSNSNCIRVVLLNYKDRLKGRMSSRFSEGAVRDLVLKYQSAIADS